MFSSFRKAVLVSYSTIGALWISQIYAAWNPSHLSTTLGRWTGGTQLFWSTSLFACVSLIYEMNSVVSYYASNNWHAPVRVKPADEIVLITGGSSGIGLAMAEAFHRAGFCVVIWDVNAPRYQLDDSIRYQQVDITSTTDIAKAASKLRKSVGNPTILINNAGIGHGSTILASSEQQVRSVFAVNTFSHYWMTQEFLPRMIDVNHGHVVTIASMGAFIVHTSNVDYSASKAAAVAFHEGLAIELNLRYKAPCVRTTLVVPGYVKTPLTEEMYRNPKFPQNYIHADDVASRVLSQVLSGSSGKLVFPAQYQGLLGSRGFPQWLQLYARNEASRLFDISTFAS